VIPVMIIPILNRYDLLEKSIESIDFPIKEILILDNGDGIDRELSSSFVQKIRVLRLPSNLGLSASWNLGFKLYPHEKFWIISSADTVFNSGNLEKLYSMSSEEKFILSSVGYGLFSIGEDFIRTVGLFDEYFYPIYFEDNDYEDRIKLAGLGHNIINADIIVNDNGGSQTIKSSEEFTNANNRTFVENEKYYKNKVNTGNYDPRGWDLDLRRRNEWIL
jgi:GT2 family glycosyltransferase